MVRKMSLSFVMLLAFAACSQAEDMGEVETANITSETVLLPPDGPIQRCMNLGNGLDAPYEGAWTYRIEDSHVLEIAAAGFDTIRLPIRWDTRTNHAPPYKIETEFFERVDHLVDLTLSQGLKIILDVHHYRPLYDDPIAQEARFLAMWEQISERYAAYPDSVIFEVINEPVDNLTNARLEVLYPKVMEIIRRSNPDRWVILSGDNWGSIEGMVGVQFPEDDRTIWSYHSYHPHSFTHQGASWSTVKQTGVTWGTEAQYVELTEMARFAAAYGAKNGKPIFLGEFGSYGADGKAPRASRLKWLTHMRKIHEQHNIGWCAWDFGAAFYFYDVTRGRWDGELLNTLMGD